MDLNRCLRHTPKITNLNTQIPNKSQIRNSNEQNILANSLFFDGFLHVLNFEFRSLAIICNLEFGAWNFNVSIKKTARSDSDLP